MPVIPTIFRKPLPKGHHPPWWIIAALLSTRPCIRFTVKLHPSPFTFFSVTKGNIADIRGSCAVVPSNEVQKLAQLFGVFHGKACGWLSYLATCSIVFALALLAIVDIACSIKEWLCVYSASEILTLLCGYMVYSAGKLEIENRWNNSASRCLEHSA